MRPRDALFLLQLMNNQWMEPRSLRRLQDAKLRRLVRHAYDRVPYYHRLLDSAGVRPEEIRGVKDLDKLPLTSRQDLARLPPEEGLAQGIDPHHCPRSVTSGSTGIPLTIYHDRTDLTRMNLAWGRVYLVHGVKLWHRMAAFTGRPDPAKRRSWYEYLGLMQRKELSTWDDPAQWIAELEAWEPHALTGYVMTLKLLALALQEHAGTPASSAPNDMRLNVVFQSSGLLDEASRRFLRSVFRTRIVDIYGSAEAGCVAWECDICPGYHVSADMVLVELLDGGQAVPPGSEGEVVVTNLHSYAMPFIRYRQGDVARWAEESAQCGRGLPTMQVIEGRQGDFVTLPSGKRLSPHHFFIALDTVPGLARWQLVQEDLYNLTVDMIVEPGSGRQVSQAARDNLTTIVGQEVEIAIHEVSSLPYDPAQKFRSVQSRVQVP
jgi:phenylacetate-CoA ligase